MPRPHALGIRQLDFTFPIPSWDIIANESGSLGRTGDWQTAWFEWRLFGGDRDNGDHFEINYQRQFDAPPDSFEMFRGVIVPQRRFGARGNVAWRRACHHRRESDAHGCETPRCRLHRRTGLEPHRV